MRSLAAFEMPGYLVRSGDEPLLLRWESLLRSTSATAW